MAVSRLAKTPRTLRIVEARLLECVPPLRSLVVQEGVRSAQGIRRCVLPAPSSLRLSTSQLGMARDSPNLDRRYKIRRYGFHGTSHRYVAYRYRQLRNLSPEETNIITLHLGNGCSATAENGRIERTPTTHARSPG